MAQPATVPQHVTAQLSHLTSRPGVKSTLILSRKDGTIIQATGQLSTRGTPGSASPAAHTPAAAEPLTQPVPVSSGDLESTPVIASESPEQNLPTASTSTPAVTTQETTYKPSHAETLAAHIFALVSSSSALSTCLSPSTGRDSNEPEYGKSNTQSSSYTAANGGGETNKSQDDDRDGHEREEDDELKLLRLRTKIHEIIIIPDRRFLLCVVHDVSGANSAGGGR